MSYDTLLAKSRKSGCDEITLLEHTRHVVIAARVLFGTAERPTRLGKCWLRFFRLSLDTGPIFYANLLAVCALHDWGKANDGFQAEVRDKRRSQAIRHEHLSALLIGLPQVTRWLQGNPLLDIPIVLSAVMTHHLKARFGSTQPDGFAQQLRDSHVCLECNHKELRQLSDEISKTLGLSQSVPPELPRSWRFDDRLGAQDITEHRQQMKSGVLRALQEDCAGPNEPPTERQRLLIAVRVALIAADAAGSGLVREGKTPEEWIKEQFPETARWNRDAVWRDIIDRRRDQLNEQLAANNKPLFQWNAFQLACDVLPSRALLLAPCGSGKTLAAWRWIAAQAQQRPVNRIIFLYPTRATAKEGFRDYVSWAPEAAAALMHGTATFDLHDMFDNEMDPRYERSYETERRLFALGFWAKSVFSATVDQFLSFMQYSYSAVCMLPVLADAVVVIDEVHSFDRNMFSALKRFLQCFDVPVFCMTATLTDDRRNALEHECAVTLYNDKPADLAAIANQPRYRLTVSPSRDRAAGRVSEVLADGRRVLWVVNTVKRCHEVLRLLMREDYSPLSDTLQLTTRTGFPIYCYHSRFTLDDRRRRHEGIVSNMRPGRPACLGVTTQVCEMSLDLDVDLLVTEYCPVTSLIQRMGRCNRERATRPLAESGEIIVYEPDSRTPYSEEDMTGLDEFLSLVRDKDLSQSDLEIALGEVPSPSWPGDSLCMFVESGPYASTGDDGEQFREGDDYTGQCVRLEDVRAYLDSPDEKKPGYVLPVPKKLAKWRSDDTNVEHRRLPHYLGVAAPGHYHTLLGYSDSSLDQWRAR